MSAKINRVNVFDGLVVLAPMHLPRRGILLTVITLTSPASDGGFASVAMTPEQAQLVIVALEQQLQDSGVPA